MTAQAVSLNWLDQLIASVSPKSGYERLAYKRAIASAGGYEGGRASRLRKPMRDNRGPDLIVASASQQTRNYARHLERNHDLARGALKVMVRNIVGAKGISTEPMPRRADGKLHVEFADQIARVLKLFERRPEVTGNYNWAMAQRKACGTWLRDGEMFTQTIAGTVPGLRYRTDLPFVLELLEPDFVPLDYENLSQNIVQGIRCNSWGEKTGFFVYKSHPLQGQQAYTDAILKEISADRMVHLALCDRLHQRRGITLFAAVINSLEDIREIKDYELAASKIASALTAVITREKQDGEPPGSDSQSENGNPLMKLEAGMIFDGAKAGEGIHIVDSKRPNAGLEPFINFNVRGFAAGIDGSYSSMSRNYNGTYSAQRQELVEVWESYRTMREEMVGQFNCPIYERIVSTALAAGILVMPRDLDPYTLFDAQYRGPAMPWIQPVQEAEGELINVRAGFKSMTQVIRERNGDPWTTIDELAEERRYAAERRVLMESDPATDHERSASAEDDPATGQPVPGSARARHLHLISGNRA